MKNFKLVLSLASFILIVLSVIFFQPTPAEAASFGFFADKTNPVVGDIVTVDLKIESTDVGINAGQATVKFPTNILKVQSLDKTDSVFNFWLTEPSFDNDAGTISFIGGSTASGYSGKSLQVLKIKLNVIGNGDANLTFSDTAITAADGTGANVLSVSKGLTFSVLSKTEVLKATQTQITRAAEISAQLPPKPILNVLLYPNPLNWYNSISDFSAKWSLPNDITGVAATLDKIPTLQPSTSEGLFDNKNFKIVSNGIYYLHIRFKNNIGWGQTNNYRIAVDSIPPLSFKINVAGGLSSDNPTPTLNYSSSDQFSGIDHYSIKIDNLPAENTNKNSYTTPLLSPGNHLVDIMAYDKASNATESRIYFNTLPIASPVMNFTSKDTFVGEGALIIGGTSIPNTSILLSIKDLNNSVISPIQTKVDNKGNWSTKFEQPLKKGTYFAEAIAEDTRGALSLPVKSETFTIRERPLLTIAGIEITQFWFFIALLIIILGGFATGWFSYQIWRTQLGRKTIIAQRDIINNSELIEKDISKLLKSIESRNVDIHKLTEIEFILRKIRDNITKDRKYIVENINEINK